MVNSLTMFGGRRRMALSSVLSFPFVPLFLTSLPLPERKASRSGSCNTQIPQSPP